MRRIQWNWVLVWALVLGVAGSLLWLYQQNGFAAFTPGLR
jgi:hypothetical protein